MNNKFLFEIDLNDYSVNESLLPIHNIYEKVENLSAVIYIVGSYTSQIDLASIHKIINSDNSHISYSLLNGDYILLLINKEGGYVDLVSDKNGKYRAYFSVHGNKLIVSNHFFSHITFAQEFKLSNRGIFQMLNSNYLSDPDTLAEEIKVLPIGCYSRVSKNKSKIIRYYNPIIHDAPLFESEDECVKELDESLNRVFSNRYDSFSESPFIMLSGGIDSLILMEYMRVVKEWPLNSITFAVKDIPNEDLISARNASSYFKSNHFEVQIDPNDTWNNLLESIAFNDSFTYANVITSALNNRLKSLGFNNLCLVTGQDTRLPSPGFDLGTFIGIKKNITQEPLHFYDILMSTLANGFKWWKGKGSNLIQGFLKKSQQLNDENEFFDLLLAGSVHFNGVSGKPFNRNQFFNSEYIFENFENELNVFKSFVSYFFLSQCTDNMNEYVSYLEYKGHRIDFPFVDSDFVTTCNSIPINLSSKPIYTFKTGSKVPIARKYLLRKLMENKVPKNLLWRRKATPFTAHQLFNESFYSRICFVLNYYKDYILSNSSINEINKNTLKILLDKILSRHPGEKMSFSLTRQSIKILYLLISMKLMDTKSDEFISSLKLKEVELY